MLQSVKLGAFDASSAHCTCDQLVSDATRRGESFGNGLQIPSFESMRFENLLGRFPNVKADFGNNQISQGTGKLQAVKPRAITPKTPNKCRCSVLEPFGSTKLRVKTAQSRFGVKPFTTPRILLCVWCEQVAKVKRDLCASFYLACFFFVKTIHFCPISSILVFLTWGSVCFSFWIPHPVERFYSGRGFSGNRQ